MNIADRKIYVFEGFLLDPSEGLLLYNRQPVTDFRDMVFELLHIFVQKPFHVFSRDELMEALWGADYCERNENTLTKYISDLRDTLKKYDHETGMYIETRRKKGYRFVCSVTRYDVEGVADEVESLYTKAVFNLHKYSKVGFEKAIEFFNHAIELNDSYAPAFAGLAGAYIWYTVFCYNTLPAKQMLEKAREYANRALAIDSSLAAAYTASGFIKIFHDWDWEQAEEDFRMAVKKDKSYAPGHLGLSLLFAGKNDDETFREIDLALHYDRFSRLLSVAKGIAYFEMRRFSQALKQFRETEEETREYVVAAFDGAYFGKALIYTQEGRFDEAFEAAQKAYNYSGNILDQIVMCYISTVAQRKEEANLLLDILMEQVERRYVSPFHLATIFLARGDKARACEWLERACEERDPWVLFLRSDARFDALQSDDCFKRLLQRINLAPLKR